MRELSLSLGGFGHLPGHFQLKKVDLSKGNPIHLHPQLNDIWSDDLNVIAIEALDEAIHAITVNSNEDIGEIYLITNVTDNVESVIGITGFLPWDDGDVGLRWHGLIPSMRGNGLSLHIIEKMRQLAHQKYPQAKRFIEFMPVTNKVEHVHIREYFETLGFEKINHAVHVPWSNYPWQEFAADIQASFIKHAKVIKL